MFQVNNEDVNLDRGGTDGESVCYTDANPFYIKLLNRDKRREEVQLRSTKKRAKSPTKKECTKGKRDKSEIENRPPVSSSSTTALQPQPNCKFSVKLGKINPIRCTPERKRRRRSRIAEPVDLHSSRWHDPDEASLTIIFYCSGQFFKPLPLNCLEWEKVVLDY